MNDPLDDRLDDALDAQLRAAFAPPPAARFAATARAASGVARRPLWPWFAAAAAALLVTIGFLVMRPARGPEGHDGAQLGAMWAAAFEHAEANGFGSGSCCDPGQDVGMACEQRFSVRLGVGDGVTLQGCYCGLPTGGCVAALAHTAHGPMGVFLLPRGQDPLPCLPAGSSLQLSRRELGPLVLYAVSRGAATQSLQEFRIAP